MFEKTSHQKDLAELKNKTDAIFLKIEEVSICRLYNFYQHREPHQKEINYWINEIREGKTDPTKIKESIMNSPTAKEIERKKLKALGVNFENDVIGFKEINGDRFYFDSNDHPLLEFSILQYEKNVEKWKSLLQDHLTKGAKVLDIGANIGLFTLLLAQLVGDNGKVYAFEPSPKTFQFLKRNVDYSPYKNVEIIPKAVTSNVGKLNFVQISSVHSYLLKKDRPHPNKVEVLTTTVDSFLSKINESVDFIFMDAEGFEEDILIGGTNTLKNNKIKIITEYNPGRLIAAGTTPESFIDTIINFGFDMYVLEESKGKLTKYDKNHLLKNFSVKNEYPLPKYTNLFLTKDKIL